MIIFAWQKSRRKAKYNPFRLLKIIFDEKEIPKAVLRHRCTQNQAFFAIKYGFRQRIFVILYQPILLEDRPIK